MSCDQCLKTFKSANGLRTHKAKIHTQGVKLSCRLCPKTFPNERSLKRHEKALHNNPVSKLADTKVSMESQLTHSILEKISVLTAQLDSLSVSIKKESAEKSSNTVYIGNVTNITVNNHYHPIDSTATRDEMCSFECAKSSLEKNLLCYRDRVVPFLILSMHFNDFYAKNKNVAFFYDDKNELIAERYDIADYPEQVDPPMLLDDLIDFRCRDLKYMIDFFFPDFDIRKDYNGESSYYDKVETLAHLGRLTRDSKIWERERNNVLEAVVKATNMQKVRNLTQV